MCVCDGGGGRPLVCVRGGGGGYDVCVGVLV